MAWTCLVGPNAGGGAYEEEQCHGSMCTTVAVARTVRSTLRCRGSSSQDSTQVCILCSGPTSQLQRNTYANLRPKQGPSSRTETICASALALGVHMHRLTRYTLAHWHPVVLPPVHHVNHSTAYPTLSTETGQFARAPIVQVLPVMERALYAFHHHQPRKLLQRLVLLACRSQHHHARS